MSKSITAAGFLAAGLFLTPVAASAAPLGPMIVPQAAETVTTVQYGYYGRPYGYYRRPFYGYRRPFYGPRRFYGGPRFFGGYGYRRPFYGPRRFYY